MKKTDNIAINVCNSNFLYNISQSNRGSCLIFDLRAAAEIEKTGTIKGSVRLNPFKTSGNGNSLPENHGIDLASLIDQEISDILVEKLKHLMRNFCFLILSSQELLRKDTSTDEEDIVKVSIDDLLPTLKEDNTKEPELATIQNGLEIYRALQSQKVRELYTLGDGLENYLKKYPFFSTLKSRGEDKKGDSKKETLLNYPNEIYNQIFLGNVFQVREKAILTALKITHVLNTADEVDISTEELMSIGVQYHKLPIRDYSDFDIAQYFEEAYQIMSSIIESDTKNNILVHCARGKCRSAAIVTMYLMKKHQWSFKKALGFISRKNDSVCLNLGFEEALEKFEKSDFLFVEKSKQ